MGKILVGLLVLGMVVMYPNQTVRVFKASVDGVSYTYHKAAPLVKSMAKKAISKVEQETKTAK
jgi:hypothetical protein